MRLCPSILDFAPRLLFEFVKVSNLALLLSLLFCAGCISLNRRSDVPPGDAFAVEPQEYVMVRGANVEQKEVASRSWLAARS